MADDLDISGGTTAVTTEDLDQAAEQLEQLFRETATLAADLARIHSPHVPGASYSDQSRVDIELAIDRLRDVSQHAGALHLALTTAGTGYAVAERLVGVVVRGLEVGVANVLGRLAPVLVVGNIWVTLGAALWTGIAASGGIGKVADKAFGGVPSRDPFLRKNNELITDVDSVNVVRTLAQLAGPALLGALGVPAVVPQLVGVKDYEIGARGLIAVGQPIGLLRETGVKLVDTVEQPVLKPPQDYADRLSRVPHVEGGAGPQVVIEKYTVPDEPDRYSVYVGGTVTFSPSSPTEPWDMTSNLFNAAGIESGSVESVREAMAAAGIDENSPVQFTGYSQGGGTAARLAASGLYNTQGLTTFGGPTGQVQLPDGFPAVLVEHADDLVPALGGEQDNQRAVLVRREVFADRALPEEWAVPAHRHEYYMETARLMDLSNSPQLDATIAELDRFTKGATLVSSTAYQFERTKE